MELQVFENSEFGKVRTLMAENGNILFCGIDVARALGYSNPRKALLDHCKGVTKRDTLTMGGKQAMSFIFEPDLYRLIIKSKLPSAERFEHWVFEQVLPCIRQDGHYLPPELQKHLNVLEEKAEYLNHLLEQAKMTSIRNTAKLLHIPERLFIKLLEDMRFAYRNGENRLTPYSDTEKSGYARLVVFHDKGRDYSGLQMKITPLGRLWLFNRFKKQFALPGTACDYLSSQNIERLKTLGGYSVSPSFAL